jgi:hypothetical protein
MKITWEPGINHHEEVRRMIEKGYLNNMTPIEMLHVFVLDDIVQTLSPTHQLFIEKVMKLKNCNCDVEGAYQRGVNDMTIEVRSMAKYIKKRLTK